jgi:hypothetical protein
MNSAVMVIAIITVAIGAGVAEVLRQPVIGGVIILLGIIFALTLRTAAEWERAVVLRLGRFAGIRGPGLYFLIPAFETVYATVDTRRQSTRISAEDTLTADAISVTMDSIMFCSRSPSTVLSWTFAAVVTTAWITLLCRSTPKCAFVPKYHWLPSLGWYMSGSHAFCSFLVELGALMMLASTIVPLESRTPLACRCSRPKSMPTNQRIERMSYNASSVAGSERLNHCCKQ